MGINILCIIIWLEEFFLAISSKTLTASILLLDKQLYIEFFIPQKNESLHSQINQQVPFSWFNSKFVSSTHMNAALLHGEEKKIKIMPIKSEIKGKIAENTFKIENSLYNLFSYYEIELTDENERSLSNGLTFSYLVDDFRFSFIYMLYHSNSIDKLQYAIFPNKYEIYFGEIPNALISNQSRVKCDIINNRWSCLLHKIYLSNNESLAYNCTNIEAIFQAQEVNIYVDHNFLSFFVQTVNNCIIEGREEERYVSCQITSFKKNKNLTFVMGDASIVFPIEDLFSCSEYGCFSLFHYSNRYDYLGKNVWVLGTAFILKFNSVYDYNSRAISLYSKSLVISPFRAKQYNAMIKEILIGIILIMTVMIVINIKVKIIYK